MQKFKLLFADDQSDYFSVESNQWLSKAEREKIAKAFAEQKAKAEEAKNRRTISPISPPFFLSSLNMEDNFRFCWEKGCCGYPSFN